ncbi:GDSL-type esterase/lipase family protein [Demequina rhizosphaerae]|uniref:hyaluronate lyase N-terminal domain-containing protein n=1 Tax=Demequina rhizosphaerae TaxID=1638985 RepID=UPI00078229E2|nr:GDSL-type esterase/lipase family protein [Demequina rhizosphaerae]
MATILLRRGTWAEWQAANPVLKSGEPGYELDTGRFRVGDGSTRFVNLPAFLNSDDIDARISTAVEGAGSTAMQDTIYGDATAVGNVTDGRGEIVMLDSPVADSGTVSSIRVHIQANRNAVSQAQVQLLALNKDASSRFVVSRVSSLYDLPVGDVGSTSRLDVDFAIEAGEYVALEVESGIAVGYNPATGSGVGYYYDYNRSDLFSIAAGQTLTTLVAYEGQAFGFAYTVTSPYDVADSITAFMSRMNPLQGKTCALIGDSMASGYGVDYGTEDWGTVLANRNSMTMDNYAVEGTLLSSNSNLGVVDRYSSMSSGADYVIVQSGTNDAVVSVPLGEEDSTTVTQFNGALNVLCDGLVTRYPTSRIAFITPYRYDATFDPYIDAIIARCALRGIPVFNNRDIGGIAWGNSTQRSALSADAKHLNASGQIYAARKYEAFLRTL